MLEASEREAIRSAIERDREAITEDLGSFSVEDTPDNVVITTPEPVAPIDPRHESTNRWRCYLVQDRIVYDDYFPPTPGGATDGK